jgi:hypothetical protein
MNGMRRTFEWIGRKTRYAEISENLANIKNVIQKDGELKERINEIASLVNCDKASLGEGVLESVARKLKEAETANDNNDNDGSLAVAEYYGSE